MWLVVSLCRRRLFWTPGVFDIWSLESGHPWLCTNRFTMASFQTKKRVISVGLAERIVLLFGRDPNNVSNSVRSAHFCLEYDDWREAFLRCSKRSSMARRFTEILELGTFWEPFSCDSRTYGRKGCHWDVIGMAARRTWHSWDKARTAEGRS